MERSNERFEAASGFEPENNVFAEIEKA